MAYDYTPTTSPVTGLLAPLPSIVSTYLIIKLTSHQFVQFNFFKISSIDFWISKGLPKSKLVLGMPAYARSFALEDTDNYGIGAPVTGPGGAGTYTKELGFLSYYEVDTFFS